MGYDYDRQYSDKSTFSSFVATEKSVAARYGRIVKAIPLSNREYQHRYDRLKNQLNMKEPPLSGRIFSGYLVVRNFGNADEYETWIPDHGFEEVYEPFESADQGHA